MKQFLSACLAVLLLADLLGPAPAADVIMPLP